MSLPKIPKPQAGGSDRAGREKAAGGLSGSKSGKSGSSGGGLRKPLGSKKPAIPSARPMRTAGRLLRRGGKAAAKSVGVAANAASQTGDSQDGTEPDGSNPKSAGRRVAEGAAVAALGPYPTEVEHAQGWLSLAGATEIGLLGWDSPDWQTAAAKMVEDRLVSTARWCSDVWQQPWSGVAASQMAAAVSVAAQGDTDPEDWLWSPFGEPILGNSARLEGSQRHLAHMALLDGRYGKPAHTHETLLRIAEEHAKSLAEKARTEARTVMQRRERLLLRAPALLHTAEQERTDEAMRAAEDTVRALHAATLDLLTYSLEASPADAPSAIDATVAATINVWLVEGWKLWVYDRIATFVWGLHPEERPVNSLRLWMVADLMARNAFYSTAADIDEQAAAETFAAELLGRVPDVNR